MEKKFGYTCGICGKQAGISKHHNIIVCHECECKLYNSSYRRCKRCEKEGWHSSEPSYMKIFKETQETLGFSYQQFGRIFFLTSGCASCCKEDLPENICERGGD